MKAMFVVSWESILFHSVSRVCHLCDIFKIVEKGTFDLEKAVKPHGHNKLCW